MKRFLLMTLFLTLLACPALGGQILKEETEAVLPDGVHSIRIPAGTEYQEPESDEKDLKGAFLREPDLEILVFAYDARGTTVESLAQALTDAGRDAQIREISGETFLVYQERDESDGAGCVGYSYLYNGWMTEIAFFYGSQEAADMTVSIMESFHE